MEEMSSEARELLAANSGGQEQRKAPIVTGLSPKEGIPGTQIVIRGENFGASANDLLGLYICGTDCLMTARWESAHKLIARVGQAKGGLGDVLVATKSGGKGVSMVKFRVYTVQIGPLQESAVWVDESRTVPGREVAGKAAAAALVDEDPLGISDESDRHKFEAVELAELFPDGTGNRRLENFVPALYLLENHRNANFNDLKTGLAYMQRQAKTLREGPKDLLKANLSSFISCVDSLAALHDKLQLERNTRGWPLTRNLQDKVVESKSTADKLFHDVLSRKDKADATRNALSTLTRFRFIFFLPQSIDNNLHKGEYSAILNDYARAKSLFGETDVPLFKEAMNELEIKMQVFKRTLKERLVEMPISFDEQRKIIRYLLTLEPDSDPGWDCIVAHHSWLESTLWEKQQAFWTSAVNTEALNNDSESETDEKLIGEIPQRYDFVEDILCFLSKQLQPFWTLTQTYVSGPSLSSKSVVHKEDDVQQMLVNVINVASWLMLNALLPQSLTVAVISQYGNQFVKWPPVHRNSLAHLLNALKNIRNCISSLLGQDFTSKHLQPLAELSITVRLKCLSRVVEKTKDAILSLQAKENWKIQTTESDYSKTELLDLFENQIGEIMPTIGQVMSHGAFKGETDLFSREKFRSMIVDMFVLLMDSLKETIERLVRFPSRQDSLCRPAHLLLNNSATYKDASTMPVKGKKLLIALSNVDYFLQFTLNSVCKRLADNGVKYADQVLNRCRQSFVSLRTALIKAFISAKCAPFGQLIDSVDYAAVVEVAGVSNYVKDLILVVVFVRAELFLMGSQFTSHVISFVVRSLVEQLTDHVKTFSASQIGTPGSTQAAIDVAAVEEAVTTHLTADTRQLLNSARADFTSQVDLQTFQRCLTQFRNQMRLSLLSLRDTASSDASTV